MPMLSSYRHGLCVIMHLSSCYVLQFCHLKYSCCNESSDLQTFHLLTEEPAVFQCPTPCSGFNSGTLSDVGKPDLSGIRHGTSDGKRQTPTSQEHQRLPLGLTFGVSNDMRGSERWIAMVTCPPHFHGGARCCSSCSSPWYLKPAGHSLRVEVAAETPVTERRG